MDRAEPSFADRRRVQRRAEFGELAWLDAESCLSPALSPDGGTLAYVSDRSGCPQLWLTDATGRPGFARAVPTGDDLVRAVSWSPDGEWLCLLTAPNGGERTRVRALRPDGSGQRIIAGTPNGAAMLGRWQAGGHMLGVTETNPLDASILDAHAVDVCTGRRRLQLASGHAAFVCGFSHDGRYALVRVGRRGARGVLLVDTRVGGHVELLGEPAGVADARFGPDDRTIYLHTDAGRGFAALLALPRVAAGYFEAAIVVAERDGVELERFALEPTGRAVACVWNVDGRSELELRDLVDGIEDGIRDGNRDGNRAGAVTPVPVPAEVITGCAFARDGGSLVLAVESTTEPPRVLCFLLPAGPGTEPARFAPAEAPAWPLDAPVRPELHRFAAEDGLELTGWFYRPDGGLAAGPDAVLIWLHGGPEAQERPVFNPLYQALLSQGVAVFAPNVRGSGGLGRRFVQADDGELRFSAITDVAATVGYLVAAGIADPERVGLAGRSYGGYLTLAALVEHPELFRVGVSVCGIADFESFYAYTEPWIGAPAVSEYGDPRRDGALLRALSPIHRIERLAAPLLVVHGAHDTNVPLAEAEQLVAALRDRGCAPGYLVFADEGHEVLRTANRTVFVRDVAQWLLPHLAAAGERTA